MQTHYYIYEGSRYENMKDCLRAIGNGTLKSKRFKYMLQLEVVQKNKINTDTQMGAGNSKQNYETRKRRV